MLPKMGNELHRRSKSDGQAADFRDALAATLKQELGTTHQAIKTVMAWTGASERTAMNTHTMRWQTVPSEWYSRSARAKRVVMAAPLSRFPTHWQHCNGWLNGGALSYRQLLSRSWAAAARP